MKEKLEPMKLEWRILLFIIIGLGNFFFIKMFGYKLTILILYFQLVIYVFFYYIIWGGEE